ncbi:MAG: MoaD/ThiS family protein [Acidimicrobiales bacterium]
MSAELRLFAGAREAAGCTSAATEGATVAEVLELARRQFGPEFARVLTTCRVWLNGQPADPDDAVGTGDEVAILPPVSGGLN